MRSILVLTGLLIFLSLDSAVFSSSPELTVRSFDSPVQDFKLRWKIPEGGLGYVAISPDGNRVLVPVTYDGFYLYDVNGTQLWYFPDIGARFGEFSDDGSELLLGRWAYYKGPAVTLLDTHTFRQIWNYSIDALSYAELSGSGQRAVIVGANTMPNGTLQRLAVVRDRDGFTRPVQIAFDQYPSNTAISRDGNFLALGSNVLSGEIGMLFLVDLASGRTWNATLPNGVWEVSMSANASLIVAGTTTNMYAFSNGGRLLWNVSLPGYPQSCCAASSGIQVSQDGAHIAVVRSEFNTPRAYVLLFDHDGREVWKFNMSAERIGEVTALSVARDASKLAVGDFEGNTYVLDRMGNILSRSEHGWQIGSLAVERDTVAVVAANNVMYVTDSTGKSLWVKAVIGNVNNVGISQDGKRIVATYDGGSVILDDQGHQFFIAQMQQSPLSPSLSALSSDGRLAVFSGDVKRFRYELGSVLAWLNIDSGQWIRNLTIRSASRIDSLSMAGDGSLVAVSGTAFGNYTFIDAYDSQGQRMWQQLTRIQEVDPFYHDASWVESTLAVSGDGEYVAAARRQIATYRGGHCCDGGTNNGVVLFTKAGQVVWNYSTSEWIWNAAISHHGDFVVAGGANHIFEFNKQGRIVWTIQVQSGLAAVSEDGQHFIAGHDGGGLFLGNSTGPYWQMGVDGHVQSVGISSAGETRAAVIFREYPLNAYLVYLLDSDGRILGNYTYNDASGGQVAIAGNGCCVLASLQSNGLYYYAKATPETQPPTQPVGIQTATVATVLLTAALATVVVAVVRHRRKHFARPVRAS